MFARGQRRVSQRAQHADALHGVLHITPVCVVVYRIDIDTVISPWTGLQDMQSKRELNPKSVCICFKGKRR